ncbi:anti-sigma factor [Streptomyces sp. TRM66268-LWL]|uniref:Regulator of SigK n=1 Tax=Streptomyces polyasparticus TaxID=2767826 RepID=A0ABR7SC44_9ACTN|nr:anti-sigma factor [Streptomyces polyasparticus]MBC9712744.1 anti-sigma factor [Streptomyces polyasparticus]
MNSADLHTATGAYVLHALAPAEEAEFERHLAACEACAQEVEELAATTARLGLAVAAPVPDRMKEQVLQRIATVRQEPPRVSARGRVRSWTRSLPKLALAACLAAAVTSGALAVWQHRAAEDARSQARQAEQQAADLASVLAAPDAKVSVGELADGARGTVVVSRTQDRAAFIAAGLPELGDGKVYQLWFNDGDAMRPAGLFSGAGAERAVLLDGRIDGATGMGITVEPAGGSPEPTTEPVGLMDFPA